MTFPRVALVVLLAAPLEAQIVSDVSAVHTTGQTFVTWKSPREQVAGYVIYRSTRPIRTSFSLRAAERLAVVKPGQAANHRLTVILGTPQFFRLPFVQQNLRQEDELFVVTATRTGSWYYAVMAVGTGSEVIQIRPARNTTASPVYERPGDPKPVFQQRITWNNKAADLFVHWGSNVSIPSYPAMTSAVCYPFNLALVKNGKAPVHPLVVRLHGRGDHFLNYVRGSGNPQEWLLLLDDYLPGEVRNTFWYGYHESMDVWANPLPVPTSGRVVDYTTARLRWSIDWARRTLPVDTSRIILAGVSMGASGAVFLGLTFGDRLAAVFAQQPRLNYAIESDPNIPSLDPIWRRTQTHFQKLWGAQSSSLKTTSGLNVYDRLNFNRMLSRVKGQAVPPMMIFGGTNDATVGWLGMAEAMRGADSARLGAMFFWDQRQHEVITPAYWSPMEHLFFLSGYRNDRSYLSATSVTANNNPGSGLKMDGDSAGCWNCVVETVEPIVDEPVEWSCNVRTKSLATRDGVYRPVLPITATIRPQRVRRFLLLPGAWYSVNVKSARDETDYLARADPQGGLEVASVRFVDEVTRVEIRPLAGP